MTSLLSTELLDAFSNEMACTPLMSLHSGNAIDNYDAPASFDPQYDHVSDEYLERFHWGISYLDPVSWRHYLPHLFQYAFRRMREDNVVIDALLNSLRPPERSPPRLGSLSPEQESAVRHAIGYLAFAEGSAHAEFACQLLEEWWLPHSIYRPTTE